MITTLIVPNVGNAEFNAGLHAQLCAKFGGFTAVQGQGGWKAENHVICEPVTVYTIATGDKSWSVLAFRALAKEIARDLAQECVYLAFAPDLSAEFIKP